MKMKMLYKLKADPAPLYLLPDPKAKLIPCCAYCVTECKSTTKT